METDCAKINDMTIIWAGSRKEPMDKLYMTVNFHRKGFGICDYLNRLINIAASLKPM